MSDRIGRVSPPVDISGRKAWGCHGDRSEFHRHTQPPGRGELHTFYAPDWTLFFPDKGAHAFHEALSIVSACVSACVEGCGWSPDFRVDGFLRVTCGL